MPTACNASSVSSRLWKGRCPSQLRRQHRQPYFSRPCVKNIAVYAAIKGSESKWHRATQGTDNVGLCLAPSGEPSIYPAWRLPMSPAFIPLGAFP